jgi:hypothetical protein
MKELIIKWRQAGSEMINSQFHLQYASFTGKIQ